MFTTRCILGLPTDESPAHLWALGIYDNRLLCSKYILAKALMEKALQEKGENLREVVCVSIGNLAVSIAFLAIQYNVKATLYLPEKIPPRINELLHGMGAKVIQSAEYSVASRALPEARAYTAEAPAARAFLNQYDIRWCANVYRREIFRRLKHYKPFRAGQQPIRFVVPFGTGSLFLAACQFLQGLSGGPHSIVPTGLRIGSEEQRDAMVIATAEFPKVVLVTGEDGGVTDEQWGRVFGDFLPAFNPPLGTASVDCLVVAVKHAQAEYGHGLDVVAILTDSLMSSHFFI